MDEKIQEGNKIVQTWDNQKDWQKLSGRAMLRVGPIQMCIRDRCTATGIKGIGSNVQYAHDTGLREVEQRTVDIYISGSCNH